MESFREEGAALLDELVEFYELESRFILRERNRCSDPSMRADMLRSYLWNMQFIDELRGMHPLLIRANNAMLTATGFGTVQFEVWIEQAVRHIQVMRRLTRIECEHIDNLIVAQLSEEN